jgi:hypothetical protein
MIASNVGEKFVGHIVLDVPAKNPTFTWRIRCEIFPEKGEHFSISGGS